MPYTEAGIGYRNTDTSHAAIPSRATIIRKKVLRSIQTAPATCDEVSERLNITPFSVRPRITELKNEGVVIDSGGRRELLSGKLGIVWRVAERQTDMGF